MLYSLGGYITLANSLSCSNALGWAWSRNRQHSP